MEKKKRSTSFYLIMAFFVSSLIFVSGIGIGLILDQLKSENLSDSINDMSSSIQDAEIELLIMDFLGGNISCDYLRLKSYELSGISTDLGDKLDTFEQSNQINPEAYASLKRDYTRVLVKNWLTLENIKKSCSANYNTILYFYNNIDCASCDNQAYILQYFKKIMPDNVMIFAIDGGLNMSIVDMLKYNYGVYEYPSLVINGVLYPGYQESSNLNNVMSGLN